MKWSKLKVKDELYINLAYGNDCGKRNLKTIIEIKLKYNWAWRIKRRHIWPSKLNKYVRAFI